MHLCWRNTANENHYITEHISPKLPMSVLCLEQHHKYLVRILVNLVVFLNNKWKKNTVVYQVWGQLSQHRALFEAPGWKQCLPMSGTCQPGLLPNLSLVKIKWGLWHRDKSRIEVCPANQAQKDPSASFHSGLCFKQTIGWLSWQAQPALARPILLILYCSSGQHTFKYHSSLSYKRHDEDFLLKWKQNSTKFWLNLKSVPVDIYFHMKSC